MAGYAWDQGADITMMTLPEAARRNYIACTPLVVDGKKVEALTYDPGQGGKRGRSAMGIKDGRLALYCTRDGGTMVRTPEQLRDDLLAAGWESAIMLDGGGSSQCDFAGQRVESSRAVHDVILVYLKKEGDTVEETKTVVLDAGHDAANLANRSPDGAYYEHEFCLDMAKRMGAHLRRCGVTVVETRPDGAAVSLAERCAIANKIKDLDLFVSLHSNAAGGSGWSSARGWSAYVYGAGGEREQAAHDCLSADFFLTGANAVSLTGELVNIDGRGNRVAAIVFGPREVIVVAGMNKVVDTLDEAVRRARTIAAPKNEQRFLGKTPCAQTGCCADCHGEECICNQILITRNCRPAGRIHVILVGEELGF